MKFVSMLDKALLLDKVPGSSKIEVYGSMLKTLAAYTELDLDIPGMTEEMIVHESAAGMIMPGLFMPHLRNEELPDLFIVIGLPENPDALGADVIFMSLIGRDMSDVYLKVLSTLARYLAKKNQAEDFFAAARNGQDALWEHLQASNLSLRTVLTAEDVMSPANITIREDAPLSQAFDIFSTTHFRFLPVVDACGRLKGELSARTVIKRFFPDYVFMMENLNFLNDFSVFNEIFHSEHVLPVSKYMLSDPPRATADTPLIQLTLQLTKLQAGDVYIVDEDGVLRGVFGVDNIVSKVLRG